MKLIEINESNWLEVAGLKVSDDQKGFVAPAVGILARAYAMRKDRAEALAVEAKGQIVGIALIRDMYEEPACYDLQQFFIDEYFQNKGYGQEAMMLILEKLKAERRFDNVEVCVKNQDECAIYIYKKLGFVDTGYVSEDAPDSCNLRYCF